MPAEERTSVVIDRLEFRPRLDRRTRRNAELLGLLARRAPSLSRRASLIRCVALAGLLATGVTLGALVQASTRSFGVVLGLVVSVLCLIAAGGLALAVRRPPTRRTRPEPEEPR